MKLKQALLLVSTVWFTIGFSQEKFFTCINENGERIFSVKAYSVGQFSDGLAEVKQTVLEGSKSHYRSGFVDATGKLVIPCIYEQVYPFSFGVTWVIEPGQSGYYLINKEGKRLTEETWLQVGYFFDGHCAVYDEEGRMGFVNRAGKLVIPCKYTGDSFSEGLACVMDFYGEKANYGFIDTTGKVVIPFQFNQAGTSSFENGECRVQINGVTCLIDKTGKVIFKPTLTKNCMGFYSGLSASYANATDRSNWGYYNRTNNWVIEPQFASAENFIGAYAIVEKAGKFGVIDTTGKIIIPIQYANILSHVEEDGFFTVEQEANGARKYLKADGSSFAAVPVKYILSTGEKQAVLPYVNSEDKYGYLKADGTVLIEAQFDRTGIFSEGQAWINGNALALKLAPNSTEKQFAREYAVGDKATCKRENATEYLPATVSQVTEHYYLVTFDGDGSQVWVTYNQLRR